MIRGPIMSLIATGFGYCGKVSTWTCGERGRKGEREEGRGGGRVWMWEGGRERERISITLMKEWEDSSLFNSKAGR